MITNTTQDTQIRRTIQKTIEGEMPLRFLKQIVNQLNSFK